MLAERGCETRSFYIVNQPGTHERERSAQTAQIAAIFASREHLREADVVRIVRQTVTDLNIRAASCKVRKKFSGGRETGIPVVLVYVQDMTMGDEAALANGSGLTLTEEGSRVMTRRRRAPLSLGHACLRERFGSALQRQRNQRGISQTKLAELAGLSPKYVGEIERGEANVSIDLQERLCVALDWYPFELWVSQQETLPEGARTVLSANLQNISQLAQAGVRTLQAMESEVARAGSPPKPKRGRPRTRQATGDSHLGDA